MTRREVVIDPIRPTRRSLRSKASLSFFMGGLALCGGWSPKVGHRSVQMNGCSRSLSTDAFRYPQPFESKRNSSFLRNPFCRRKNGVSWYEWVPIASPGWNKAHPDVCLDKLDTQLRESITH